MIISGVWSSLHLSSDLGQVRFPDPPRPFLKDMDHLFYDDNDANYVGDDNYDGADVDDDDDGDGD